MRHGLLVEPLGRVGAVHSVDDTALDPEALLLHLDAAHPDADGLVWLDSGVGARTGRSFLAVGERVPLPEGEPVLPALRAAIAAMPAVGRQRDGAGDSGGDAVPLGLVGWFGYELRGETMGMPVPPVPGHHRAAWLRVDRGVLIDHEAGTASLVALDVSGTGQWSGDLADWRQRMLELVRGASAASPPPVADPQPATAVWRDDDAHYAALVARCQEAIREGEAYQLCLTTQVSVAAPPTTGRCCASAAPLC